MSVDYEALQVMMEGYKLLLDQLAIQIRQIDNRLKKIEEKIIGSGESSESCGQNSNPLHS